MGTTPSIDALEIEGICPTKEYIQKQMATIMAHIDCCPIYELCTGADEMPGSSILMKWWDQDLGWEVE